MFSSDHKLPKGRPTNNFIPTRRNNIAACGLLENMESFMSSDVLTGECGISVYAIREQHFVIYKNDMLL